jgi:glycosyltransferase involved in cell wall biosynthesis
MTDAVRALAADNIDPVGFVSDLADAYDRHRVFVAPLLSGAGIKGKVLSALARGTPAVVSPVAAEGIGLRHGHDCMIATTPAEWVSAIEALYQDAKLWQAVSDNARAYVTDRFSFVKGREQMRAAFEAVDLFQSRD